MRAANLRQISGLEAGFFFGNFPGGVASYGIAIRREAGNACRFLPTQLH